MLNFGIILTVAVIRENRIARTHKAVLLKCMHELGIAESAIKASLREMESHGAKTLVSLTIRIGELTCVDPEALQFALDAVTRSTGLEGTRIEIETVPARARCRACDYTFSPGQGLFLQCPECSSSNSELLQGREIELAQLVME